ncbi:MAG: transglycosylase SLT domain-containing protein [Gammaproteobacteria bacterium]|nr:transglycosylase SLT domain-containing protein [Gammaproteobacteria bacterium]
MLFTSLLPKTASIKAVLTLSLFILIASYQSPLSAQELSVKDKGLTANQKAFKEAYRAIKRNDRKAIAKYKSQLEHYSLYPYLLYHDYRLHLKSTPSHLIKGFIKDHSDSYLSDALYTRWLKSMAKRKHWTNYLAAYKPQRTLSLQCYYVQALSQRKQTSKALKLAKPIWQNNIKLNKACQPLDTLLRKHKKITGTMLWAKIALAMKKRKISVAEALRKDLSAKEAKTLDFWIKVYKNPVLASKKMPSYLIPSIRKLIFMQGIKRLAGSQPALAKKSLNKYRKQYALNADQYKVLDRKIALRTVYRFPTAAKAFLKEVNTSGSKSKDTLRWQAQIALKRSDWPGLLDTIELMDEPEQRNKQWVYWKARALEATKQQKAANALYEKLAKQRHYYAFLSADRLNKPYRFNPKPAKKIKPEVLIKKYPELLRIQELLAIDWPLSTKREWYHLLKKMDSEELQAVAVLANHWEQHAQAIRSLAKAKEWDHLSLRFPTPYKEPVMQNAKKNEIDAAWIYGIMRRESAFSEDIRSSVGATGLMQLMPKTAKYMSRKISRQNISYKKLTQAKNNIELGSAYLSYLNGKYSGNKVLATASYNAGPSRVDSWIPKTHSIPADQWVDAIPYNETRAYVKAVLEYTTIFNSLLNKRYDRLKDVMPDIGGKPLKKIDPKHP